MQWLNESNPLNSDWGPHTGLVARLLALPHHSGGRQWFDLCGRNHGVLTNGALWPTLRRDGAFSTVQFDGTDDYIDLVTSPVDIQSDFSVALWVNKTVKGGTDNDRFIELNTDANNSFTIGTNSGSAVYAVRLNRAGAGVINAVAYGSWDASAWAHLVYTVSGTTGTFYRNGLAFATTGSAAITPAGTGYNIGRRPDANSTTFFKGMLDDVAFWNRALTASEATAIYQDSVAGYPRALNWRRSKSGVPTGTSPVRRSVCMNNLSFGLEF